MIDVHELLRRKEDDLFRVRQEIEALRLVASLLTDSDQAHASQSNVHSSESTLSIETNPSPEDPSHDGLHPAGTLSESTSPKRSLLGWLSRAAGE